MERRERLFGIAEKLTKEGPTPIRAARSWRWKAAACASGADRAPPRMDFPHAPLDPPRPGS